jgi:hypothetical protein
VTDWIEDIGYLQTLYNHGPAIAREHAPVATLGDEDHQDIARLMEVAAKCGYKFAPSQLPGLDARFNVDIRAPGEKPIASDKPPVKAEPDDDESSDKPDANQAKKSPGDDGENEEGDK